MTVQTLLQTLRARDVVLAVDGDDLRCTAPEGVLDAELVALIRANKAGLVERLRRNLSGESASADVREEPVVPTNRSGPLPLSLAQQRLWFMDAVLPGTSLLNVPCAFRVKGPLDLDVTRRVFGEIAARHEVLRTTIQMGDAGPVQVVHPSVDVNLEVDDFSTGEERESADGIRKRLQPRLSQSFSHEEGPLWRAGVAKLGHEDQVLWFVASHLVWDGRSFEIWNDEFRALYEAFASGHGSPLSPPALQYGDYVDWERRSLDDEVRERELAYWTAKLKGVPPNLELPLDHARPAQMTYRGGMVRFSVPEEIVERLREMARAEGTTLYMVLLAVLQISLHRYTGESDVVIGTPVDGRTRAELESLVGFCVNTLAIRTKIDEKASFAAFLAAVRETCLAAYEHQHVPFEKVVEALSPTRDRSRTPLFQVLFSFRQASARATEIGGLEFREFDVHSGSSVTDLAYYVKDDGTHVSGVLEYALDLFEEKTAVRVLACFEELLAEIAAGPRIRISNLNGLVSQRADLASWNATEVPLQNDATVHQLFEKQALRNPDLTAVWFEGKSLSYRELQGRVNQLARHLRALGVERDVPVGVCLHRSIDLVVVLLAIQTAGGGYVPLDPGYPRERLSYMLEDSGAPLLVCEESTAELLSAPSTARFVVDRERARIRKESNAPLHVAAVPNQLAYSIYTSGSTGKPKGVLIEHRQVAAFFRGMTDHIDLRPGNVWLAGTSISFDISVLELLGSLTHGLTVVLLGDQILGDAKEAEFGIARLIERRGVTHFQCTPSQIGALLEDPESRAALGRLRQLLLGGEALSEALASELLKVVRGEVVNMYGPTETTIWSSTHHVDRVSGPVPIGRPIANTRFYILGEDRRHRPIGAAGELFIAGAGVVRGYHRRAELTRERFLDDPFVPGARMYRTGDMARFRQDGAVEYLGRNDHQVKIRGHRIELGEIEAVLGTHAAVKENVIVARGTERSVELVAYVVKRSSFEVQTEQLREHLFRHLPPHMVPSAFVELPAFPLTPSGKVDRNALPSPTRVHETAPRMREPRDDVERRLLEVWRTSLELQDIGLGDDFFELGGHSLLGVRLLSRVRQAFGVRLSLAVLFEAPNVEAMATRIRGEMNIEGLGSAHVVQAARVWSTVVPIQPSGSLPPLFCVAGMGGNPMNLRHVAARLGKDQPFYGLQHRGVDGQLQPHTSVEDMAREFVEHIRSVQPHGRYYLSGFSGGGTAAFEMARQLRAAGEQIGALILLESVNPLTPGWTSAERALYHFTQLRRNGLAYAVEALRDGLVRRATQLRSATLARAANVFPYECRNEAVAAAWETMERRYLPKPYPGSVFLLRSRERDTRVFDPYNGWRPLVLGELTVIDVDGGHTSFVNEEHAECSAARLAEVLAAARAPRSGVRRSAVPSPVETAELAVISARNGASASKTNSLSTGAV